MARQAGRWTREAELKQFGDRVIASPITIELSGFDDRPDLEVTFDVVDGQLRCRQVTLTARNVDEVQKRHLTAFSIDSLRETVAANWSMPLTVDADGGAVVTLMDMPSVAQDASDASAAKRNLQATRARSAADHLEAVARIYLAADRAPTQAVADHFDVAHRTAGLYVQRAREAKLIPPAPKRGK